MALRVWSAAAGRVSFWGAVPLACLTGTVLKSLRSVGV